MLTLLLEWPEAAWNAESLLGFSRHGNLGQLGFFVDSTRSHCFGGRSLTAYEHERGEQQQQPQSLVGTDSEERARHAATLRTVQRPLARLHENFMFAV